MDGKVFKKETKKRLANFVDDQIDAGWFEPVDGLVARGLVDFVDKKGDKFIPDEFDEKIDECVLLCIDGKFEEAAGKAGETIDTLVDLKWLDDDVEALVFVDGSKFIVRLLQNWIEQKKNEGKAK